jgi:hypothetical protein
MLQFLRGTIRQAQRIACVLALLILIGCKKEVAEPIDFSADYAHFPLELNQPKFYALDSIVLFNTVQGTRYDTARLEVRETLVETFTAADGTETFRGERWDRRLPDGLWRFRQTFTLSRSTTTATREEDNLRFTKLVFPIRAGVRWDGNAAFDETREFVIGGEFLNIYDGWTYKYARPEEDVYQGGDFPTFDNSTLVIQADSLDFLIEFRLAYERYAPGIGLVQRFIDARNTQCGVCCNLDFATCGDLPWDDKAEEGFILIETFLR